MKIIKFQAENFKRLRAVEITPDGNTVVISGRNEQGKSSILDAIWTALGGADAQKGLKEPIRRGEETARVKIELDDIIITRTWTKAGTYLKVENKEGATFSSPQSVLDRLIGQLTFDPLAFVSMAEKAQRDTLLKLVDLGIDLNDWQKKYQKIYDDRRDVNRDVERLEHEHEALAKVPAGTASIPLEEIDPGEIVREMSASQNRVIENQGKRTELGTMKDTLAYMIRIRDGMEKDKADIMAQIVELQKKYEGTISEQRAQGELVEEQQKKIFAMSEEVAALTDPDLTGFEERIEQANKTNILVRQIKARGAKGEELKTAAVKSDTMTQALELLQKQKDDAIKTAVFPVPNLGFTDTGVTYKGIPFSQASDEERLVVSAGIAMALNPRLKILRVNNGSLLDSSHLKLLSDMVKEKDYQLWIEVVDETGKVGVFIEDGQVKGGSA
jgi:DNA repair exonuclease SbcCD ATPase subunit